MDADDEDEDDKQENEQDGEHELDLGDTLTPNEMLTLDLELPGGTSSHFALGDGLSPNDMGMGMDIDPLMVADLGEEKHVNQEVEEAETDNDSSSFVLKLSRAKREHHMELLRRDTTLENEWRLRLLQTRAWLDSDTSTCPAKRAQNESSMGPARKATKIDPTCFERSQEALVFPDCYLPSIDRVTTLKVYGLQSTFEDDKKTVAGYLACVAAGAQHMNSSDPDNCYATPMVAKVSVEELMSSAGRLQTLLRNQHVYVTGVCPNSKWNWDLEAMKKIGNVDVNQEVHDHSKRNRADRKIHVLCSLRTVLLQGNLNSKGLVLNALFLPMPEKPLEEPRCIEEAMSQSTAFNQTREMPSDIFEVHYSKYATTFTLASTAAMFSYIHVDSMGVGTAVRVLMGKKIWFLFCRCGTVVPNGHIEEFFNDWKPGFIPDSDAWDAEMLILEPGTLLFMWPNTHHVVITLENCIVSGQHFYVSSCIEDTVVGFVHTHMWDFFITNVLHYELRPLLLRMMCYFAQVICGPGGRQASDIHCLDISTRCGLLDVVALGNFCVFATVLNGQNEEQYKEGVLLAMNCYKDIIQVASHDFVLYLPKGEQKVTPFQLAQASAKHFAAALIIYLKRVADMQHESAEVVDDPLDLECFQRGALAVLKELFDVGLPQEEIELLATKPGLHLLWRFPFIVQLKSEAFNQQLWDAQWEAMRQEADLGDSTSSEGSSGNKAHTVRVREDLTAKWRRRWRSEFVLGNCGVAIGEDDKCVRYTNTKDNGEGVLHCLLKRMIAEHNASHEVGWFMWSCQDGSKVEEKVTKTGCRHGVLLWELNADHWILIEIDLDEKEFVIWNSLHAQDSVETYANITLGLSDIFEGLSEKGKDQWTTHVDDTSPKTSRVEDSGVYSCMYAWMTMSHGGFEHPQADMWTFDSIGSALRAEFLDYLSHKYIESIQVN
ncbi:hypothetical protein EV421DRAFT_1907855 [Armillaria borealis]|uniref:Ubiquitin-like protease family profile domain-containing protein n=1 Tax=Armillaria borealis TaxID=47425 RepID=A0AA39J6D7_9AGAR|nr:hypothetical protein EV421DRAFT_1907855 [Armillaria borealis]